MTSSTETWKPDLCIYHGGCDDGFGAAWAIWKRWPDCEFVAGYYGQPLPDVAGRNVLFVDFSAPIDWIWEHAGRARSMVIIDHHKTAQADLDRLVWFDGTMNGSLSSLDGAFKTCWSQNGPELATWFDMLQSGATMAWQFAHQVSRGAAPCPRMLQYIEDRDLWAFYWGDDTRKFSAALKMYPREFEVWEEISNNVDRLLTEGDLLLRAHRSSVGKLVKEAYFFEIAGSLVPVVNAPYHYASDVAAGLLALYPDAPFAATWFRGRDGKTGWSLRSEDHRLDVSAIAKTFGGGGHRNAAGYAA